MSYMCVCVSSCFSCVLLFMNLWTVVCQALLTMGFSRREYWSGLLWPPPGNLPEPGADPAFLMAPALAGVFFSSRATTGLLGHQLLQAVVYRMRSHALHSPDFKIFLQLFWLELTKLGQNSNIWELLTRIT